MIVRQGARTLLVGLAVGLVGALAAARLMRSMLFQVSPADPSTYVLISIFLLAVGLTATWLPARRASAVDPIEALRVD